MHTYSHDFARNDLRAVHVLCMIARHEETENAAMSALRANTPAGVSLLNIQDIAKLIGTNIDTVRRYFRKGILHCHEISSDGLSILSHPESVAIRIGALKRLRTRQRNLDKIGQAIKTVCGEFDQFIDTQLAEGRSTDECIALLIAEAGKHI